MTGMSASLRGGFARCAASVAIALASGGVVSLGGCDRLTTAAPQKSNEGLAYAESTKLSSYYQLTNDLDLSALRKEFAERDVGSAKPVGTPFIDYGRLEAGLEDLKRARTSNGALKELDERADTVLQALKPLTDRAKSLHSYFTMRGYLTDGYARARHEAPLILAEYDTAIAAYAPFVATVEQATARQETFVLARMKAEGRMNDYHDILITRQTRAIRAATADRAAMTDTSAAARADGLFTELASLLERDRAAWAAAMATKAPATRPADDNLAVLTTEQMIGAYRQFRRTGDADDYAKFRAATAAVLQAGG